MRKRLFVVASAIGLGLVAATALPAAAVDTTVTFSITTAGLTISAPGSASLGSVASGTASISGQIGPVTVTDLRGTLNGSWTATVTGTDFTTGGGTGPETIPNINVSYSPGPATATTGTGTFTPGPGGIINVPRVAFTGTALVGNNSATWNPTLTVTIPPATVAGTYSGTVTHSVA
ncbi:hypothetical protein DQ384_34010 [Sphaerisporangium album]|uniref:WxL domain-containing protein n=1 Tax=Sphaerisporangium album TaxID=509200 RepID=A0A367F0H1_9ACTN|nr:hypothetical protein [Sphaerisporangium album]RCG23382.1 hypothetical protein DQ384_34010 [Sphaerisporangium album]